LSYYGDTWALPDGATQAAVTVALNASTTEGPAPLAVNFTAAASGATGPYSYNWSFGDGATAASGANVSHTYSTNGSYTATVRARDPNGSTGSAIVLIVVGPSWIRDNNWHPVGGANASTILQPASRSAPALAYDPALHEVILFGGYAVNVSAYGDTWAFSNGTWTDLTTTLTSAPPARWEPGFVWDAADGYLLLFGGRDVPQFFNDSWSFNASGWTQLHPKSSPPAGWVQMTYDSGDGYVLLFSSSQGNVPGGTFNPWVHWDITWSYLAGSWTNLTAKVGSQPPALTGSVFVNDPSAGYVLLYGGQGSTDVNGGCDFAVALTWTFAHGHWSNRTPNSTVGLPGGAGGLSDGAAAYDAALSGVLVFGGLTTAPGGGCMSIADTWLYVNGSWSERPSWAPGATPTNRHAFAMTYDAADSEALIEGGNVFNSYEYLADSWVFGPIPNPLVARASTSGTIGTAAWTVAFVASASGGTAPYSYRWDFGDGHSAVGSDPVVSHLYSSPGTFSPALTVQDHAGRSATLQLPQIRVTAAPPAQVDRSSSAPGGPLLGTTGGSLPVLAVVIAVAVAGAIAGGLVAMAESRRRALWRAEGLALGASVSGTPGPESPRANGRD
ncbi:MAG TPA: PKD domain-containing protein, partial [Thermoplasmata archaeon]|nr:PKD domain-containing protein [Thermoplasmata archaeon]